MAYADRDKAGENLTALIITGVVVALLFVGLYVGLQGEGFRKLVKRVTTVDVKKDEPKKELPPPPKQKVAPPPIVAPPPRINVNVSPPPVTTVTTPPPVAPVVPIIAPPAPIPAPPPPPAPRTPPRQAAPRGNPGNWATTNDYPSRALREEREGTTGFRVSVGPDGRVTDCSITSSSGHSDLDEATCSNVTRRARFAPATDGDGNPTTGSYASRVRWVIPKD
jgi:periplasmic protein TonB